MTRKPSPAVLRSKELDDYLRGLDQADKQRRWIEEMESVLKENMFAGENIRKMQIPPWYIDRYGVNNLYRYEHSEGHRSCYTLTNVEGIGVCPLIIDLMSHTEYNRRFRY